MGKNEIKNLNPKEKIILMNEIWEGLDEQDSFINTPQWHEEILKIRLAKVKNGEAKTISLEELKSRCQLKI